MNLVYRGKANFTMMRFRDFCFVYENNENKVMKIRKNIAGFDEKITSTILEDLVFWPLGQKSRITKKSTPSNFFLMQRPRPDSNPASTLQSFSRRSTLPSNGLSNGKTGVSNPAERFDLELPGKSFAKRILFQNQKKHQRRSVRQSRSSSRRYEDVGHWLCHGRD